MGLKAGTTNKSEFGEALSSTLGDSATVRIIEPKEAGKLRDLYELTTEKEVTTAVHTALERGIETKGFVPLRLLLGGKEATFTLTVGNAEALLDKGRLMIGLEGVEAFVSDPSS